ncbi:MAG: hypothetical protein AAFR47_25155, partial [Pseudomonadota bacterium]
MSRFESFVVVETERRETLGFARSSSGVGMLATEAIALCPLDGARPELFVTYGDAVRLAQTSPRVAAAIDWRRVARFAVDEVAPRRRRPQRPTTFPLRRPVLPTRLSPSAVAALARVAALDDDATQALRSVATAYVAHVWSGSLSEALIIPNVVAAAGGSSSM